MTKCELAKAAQVDLQEIIDVAEVSLTHEPIDESNTEEVLADAESAAYDISGYLDDLIELLREASQ